eukprot:1154773-Pelagomonas_calceolata.AAC.3
MVSAGVPVSICSSSSLHLQDSSTLAEVTLIKRPPQPSRLLKGFTRASQGCETPGCTEQDQEQGQYHNLHCFKICTS